MSELENDDSEARKAQSERAAGYYKVYEDYSSNLRTWLVAYGIGAPTAARLRRVAMLPVPVHLLSLDRQRRMNTGLSRP